MSDQYRAVVFDEYGEPSVLHVVTRDVPEPERGQVRLVVRAAGVNPFDWKLRSGLLADVVRIELPFVPGADVAGVVDAVGPDAAGFAVGDEVFGKAASGGYAELALARVGALARKPARLAWEVAAGLPVTGTTAYHALGQLALPTGATLVVDGAAGGVGTLTVQLARRRGLTVIGTAGARNQEYLRSLGATPVLYGDGLVQRVRAVAPSGVDGGLDVSGRGSVPALVELTGDPARVLTLVDYAAVSAHGVRYSSGEPAGMAAILAELGELAAAGEITLPIERTYPLAGAAAAQRDSEAGHVRGKLILLP